MLPTVENATSAADAAQGLPLLQLITLAAITILLGVNLYLVFLVFRGNAIRSRVKAERVQNTLSPAESEKILRAIEELKRYILAIESRLAAVTLPEPVSGRSLPPAPSGSHFVPSLSPVQLNPDEVLRALSPKIRTFEAKGYTSAELEEMVESGEFQYFFKPQQGLLRTLSRAEHVRDKETFCGFHFAESGVFAVTFGRGLHQFRADIQRNPASFSDRFGEVFTIETVSGQDFRVVRPALLKNDTTGVTVLQKGTAVI